MAGQSDKPRGRRAGVWAPGENLIIDWGELRIDGVLLHVFCAVMAWSRFRFVRFAPAQNAVTTMSMLAECFEELGGVPKVVLADRMGCLKGAVVANIMVPTPDYVRFATHHRFRPDFCEAADPQSKGMVENLVGYAKSDLMVPLTGATSTSLGDRNASAAAWCVEVNANTHSQICAVLAERLEVERALLGELPSLRPEFGARPTTRKVDKLSCVRFGSARYSVPNRLVGRTVTVLVETTSCGSSSPSQARSMPNTSWSHPVKPASPMTTTAAHDRTNPDEHLGPEPKQRRTSWPWERWRRRS